MQGHPQVEARTTEDHLKKTAERGIEMKMVHESQQNEEDDDGYTGDASVSSAPLSGLGLRAGMSSAARLQSFLFGSSGVLAESRVFGLRRGRHLPGWCVGRKVGVTFTMRNSRQDTS